MDKKTWRKYLKPFTGQFCLIREETTECIEETHTDAHDALGGNNTRTISIVLRFFIYEGAVALQEAESVLTLARIAAEYPLFEADRIENAGRSQQGKRRSRPALTEEEAINPRFTEVITTTLPKELLAKEPVTRKKDGPTKALETLPSKGNRSYERSYELFVGEKAVAGYLGQQHPPLQALDLWIILAELLHSEEAPSLGEQKIREYFHLKERFPELGSLLFDRQSLVCDLEGIEPPKILTDLLLERSDKRERLVLARKLIEQLQRLLSLLGFGTHKLVIKSFDLLRSEP